MDKENCEAEIGWCRICKKERVFIEALDQDIWVCTECQFRTSELLEEPEIINYGRYGKR